MANELKYDMVNPGILYLKTNKIWKHLIIIFNTQTPGCSLINDSFKNKITDGVKEFFFFINLRVFGLVLLLFFLIP
jgi:hypothetical protein